MKVIDSDMLKEMGYGVAPREDKFPDLGGFSEENLERMMLIATSGILFEINNQELRDHVLRDIDTLLTYFKVKEKKVMTFAVCDESNNNHEQIDANQFVLDVHWFLDNSSTRFNRARLVISRTGHVFGHD